MRDCGFCNSICDDESINSIKAKDMLLFVRSGDTVARGFGNSTARKLTGTPYFPYMGCRPMRVQYVGVTYLVYIYFEVYIYTYLYRASPWGRRRGR